MAGTDQSTLEISVITKGISGNGGATAQISRLGDAAEKTEPKVKALTDRIESLIKTQNRAATSAAQHMQSISGTAQALGMISTQANALTQTLGKLNSAMQQNNQVTQQAGAAAREYGTHGGVMATTLKAMTAAAMAYVGINFVSSMIKQADAWVMNTAKLKIATGSMDNAKAAQQDLYDLAQKYRAPQDDMNRLYIRSADAMKKLGKSHKDTLQMVEATSLALKLNGATAAESSSVMLQFSQSLQAGRLNGAEFNAVAEGAPLILRALEEQTGKSRGALKKMGSDGKISVELLQKALEKALPSWRKDFESLPITVDGAMTRIKNAWAKAMGELNENTGFTQGISNSLKVVEDLIPAVRDELVKAFIAVGEWIGENKTGLGQCWEQVKLLAADVWNIVGGFFAWLTGMDKNHTAMEKLAAMIFGVRLLLAGAVDIIKLISASFIHVGVDIFQMVVTPINLVLQLVGKVADGWAGMFNTASLVATAAGFEKIGSSLGAAANGSKAVSNYMAERVGETKQAISAGREVANSLLKGWESGKTEVAKVLEGQKEITKEVEKRKKFVDGPVKLGPKDVDDKAAKKAAAEAKKELDDYLKQTESLNLAYQEQLELKRRMAEFGADYDKLGEGAKKEFKYQYELNQLEGKKLTTLQQTHKTHLESLLADARKLKAIEEENAATKKMIANSESLRMAMEQKITASENEAKDLERKVATYGMAKGAIEAMELAEIQSELTMLKGSGITGEYVNQLERLVAAKTRVASAQAALGVEEMNTEALKDLDKFLNPKKALDFGHAMESAFGDAGKAIDGMAKAFDRYTDQQAKNEKFRKAAYDLKDEKKRAKVLEQIDEEATKDRLAYYGDVMGAAKGFFKENSKGYKAMEGAEKAFRLFEMAMAMKSFATKIFTIEGVTTAKTAAAAEEMITEEMSTAETIQLAMMSANAKAVEGVANQSGGDPYSAFVRMAAMAAIMAGLGLAVSGGGGSAPSVPLSEQRQKIQGTGTVMGDESAKSESISKAIEHLADNSDITLPYTSKMLMALRNIEAGIGGMATAVARSTGLRGTSADQAALGVGSSRGALGFSSSSTELQDSGILIGNQSVGSAMNKFNGSSYADLHKESSSWWGLSKSSSNEEQLGLLNPDLEKQITATISDMVSSITTAGEALGKNGPAITSQLQQMEIGLQRISLKGLSGDDLVKELEAVFSALGDTMASNVLGGYEAFQKVGEGYLETITRVATGVELAKQALGELGLTAVGLYEVQNKNGDISTEIVRTTLMNQERYKAYIISWGGMFNTVASGALNGIGEILSTLDGSATDLIAAYKQLVAVREQMKDAGLGENLNRAMVQGAGGLDELTTGMNDFMEGMFTDSEKLQFKTRAMTEAFGKLGFALPATADGFKALVQSITASGNMELAGKLIVLSGGFNDLQSALKDVADAAAEAAAKAEEDAQAAREKLLSDAHDNLTNAYEKEQQALTDTKTKFEDFAKSLRSFRDGLLVGSDSPLTNAGKYSETSSQYASTLALAQTGDKDAITKFQTMAQNFLAASKAYNASGDAYIADFNKVMTDSGALADIADQQVDVATASLEALNKQVTGLMDVKEATLSVQVAIMQLYDALVVNKDTSKYNAMSGSLMQQYAGQSSPGEIAMYSSMMSNGASYQMVVDAITKAYPMDGSHADGLGYVPFDGYRAELHKGERVLTASENKQYQLGLGGNGSNGALIAEVKALREQVQSLTEEQRQQTAALIGANFEAQEAAACKVVDGVGDALNQSARTDKVKPALN